MVRRDAAAPGVQEALACPATDAISAKKEAVVGASAAVVKVRYKNEVLRFRVAWPLDLDEVRSSVLLTLQSPETRSAEEGEEATDLTGTSSPMLLYHGSEGKLLELSDSTAEDFRLRHSDPAQPIRLHALARRSASLQQLPAPIGDERAQSVMGVEGSNIDLGPTAASDAAATGSLVHSSTDADIGPPLQNSCDEHADDWEVVDVVPSAATTSCPEAAETAAPAIDAADAIVAAAGKAAGDSVDDSSQPPDSTVADEFKGADAGPPPAATPCQDEADVTAVPSTNSHPSSIPLPSAPPTDSRPSEGAEFLGGCGAEALPAAQPTSMKHPSEKGGTLAGISLPIAARTAAYALSDALESAKHKLNDALAMQDRAKSVRLFETTLELQMALRESEELQRAIEKSAAESRVRLAAVLDLYQLRLRPVQADGNCQFRALSVQLYGDEAHHTSLRDLVVKQLRERQDRYAGYMLGTYEEYLERMARDGEWGDNVTLQAASDLLQCEIHVLTDQPGSGLLELRPEAKTVATEGGTSHKPLCLAFLTEVHYDAVVFDTL